MIISVDWERLTSRIYWHDGYDNKVPASVVPICGVIVQSKYLLKLITYIPSGREREKMF